MPFPLAPRFVLELAQPATLLPFQILRPQDPHDQGQQHEECNESHGRHSTADESRPTRDRRRLMLRAVVREWLYLRRQTLGGQPNAERKQASKYDRSLNPTS